MRKIRIAAMVLGIASLMVCGMNAHSQSAVGEIAAEQITRTGLQARLDAAQRDEHVQQLAAWLAELAREDKGQLQKLQSAFQEALLLVCDPDIYETLSPKSIEAVDNALEGIFDLEEVNRSNQWERLIYVYGFFNRDVMPYEIQRLGMAWEALSHEQRLPVYPTFPHSIDALCKPLSMGTLGTLEDTLRGLDMALPLLKEMMEQPPAPGRAFHVPTHAALVLGPIYDRWGEDAEAGWLVQKYLGTREEFIQSIVARLVANREDRAGLEDYEYTFYAYTGRYFANALTRLNAREAAPALKTSLGVYLEKTPKDAAISYTRRALAALGDAEERQRLEESKDIGTAVWLCRNGQGETCAYGRALLGRWLECDADAALEVYFKRQLAGIK